MIYLNRVAYMPLRQITLNPTLTLILILGPNRVTNYRGSCKCFLGLSVQSTQLCSLLLLLYCICVDKKNIHSFIHSFVQ